MQLDAAQWWLRTNPFQQGVRVDLHVDILAARVHDHLTQAVQHAVHQCPTKKQPIHSWMTSDVWHLCHLVRLALRQQQSFMRRRRKLLMVFVFHAWKRGQSKPLVGQVTSIILDLHISFWFIARLVLTNQRTAAVRRAKSDWLTDAVSRAQHECTRMEAQASSEDALPAWYGSRPR